MVGSVIVAGGAVEGFGSVGCSGLDAIVVGSVIIAGGAVEGLGSIGGSADKNVIVGSVSSGTNTENIDSEISVSLNNSVST